MPYMWADTLLAVERAHVLRLLAWSAASILGGTGIVAWLGVGGRRSPLLVQFALLTAAWGGVNATFALIARAGLAPRDLAAATRLDRFLWLNIGLDLGLVLVGATLFVVGWRLGRRLGLVGAGLAVIVQGSALGWLHLVLAAQISR